MTYQLEFHIERLILDGLPVKPSERAGVQEAIQQELTRLLGGLEAGHLESGLYRSLQVSERPDTGTEPLETETLGVRIALGAMQALTSQEVSR